MDDNCNCSILKDALTLNQLLSNALESGREAFAVKEFLACLVELSHAQVAYMVLLNEGMVVSAYFHADDDDVRFNLSGVAAAGHEAPVIAQGLDPVQTLEGAHKSLYGGLFLQSSMLFCFDEHGSTRSILEVGQLDGPLPRDGLTMLKSLGDYLKPGLLGLWHHVTDSHARRQYATRMERLQHEYDILVQNSHDIVVCFDDEYRILELNNMGCEVLGFGESLASARIEITNPSQGVLLGQIREKKVLVDLEVILVVKNRDHRFCLGSFAGEFDDRNEVRCVHGVLKDISDRIEIQSQLMKANMDLSEANDRLKLHQQQIIQQEKLASIGQLAAGVAHEINNPLGFILSNHTVLKDYFSRIESFFASSGLLAGCDDEQRRQKIGRILGDIPSLLKESDEGFDRIAKIVKSLKDFSHIDAQGRLASADINKALEDTITIARNNWKYVAEVKTRFELRSPVEAQLDALNQVFLNMIVNAAQAIAAQKRKEPGLILVQTSEEKGYAIIRFEDDGPGIPPHIRNKIFEPFFTTKPVGEGTGLGLSMAWDIIKKHQGNIELGASSLGGASFQVKVPLVQAKEVIPE